MHAGWVLGMLAALLPRGFEQSLLGGSPPSPVFLNLEKATYGLPRAGLNGGAFRHRRAEQRNSKEQLVVTRRDPV